MQECKDKLKSQDVSGTQIMQRYVKIPFTIGYFSGAIKMTMNVANDRSRGEVGLLASIMSIQLCYVSHACSKSGSHLAWCLHA